MIDLVLQGLIAVAYLSILGVPIGLFLGYFVSWEFPANRLSGFEPINSLLRDMAIGFGWFIFPLALALANSNANTFSVLIARTAGVVLAWTLYSVSMAVGLAIHRRRAGIK